MSYENPRLGLTDNFMVAIMKFSEGNPGAATVLLRSATESKEIDPDNVFKEFSVLVALDNLDIYGSKIWLLYKDICKENMTSMVGLLRGVQLGFISESEIQSALAEAHNCVPIRLGQDQIDAVLAAVRIRIPNFKR